MRSRRFTLMELAVVVSIVGIIAAIAMMSTSSQLSRVKLSRAGSRLEHDLLAAREQALARGRETRVHLISSPGVCDAGSTAWGGSWEFQIGNRMLLADRWDTLPLDLDDGTDDDRGEGLTDLGPDGAQRSKDVCLEAWHPLRGPGTGNSDSVVFGSSGRVTNPPVDFVNGRIVLRLVGLEGARSGRADLCEVTVFPNGRILRRLALDDGDSP